MRARHSLNVAEMDMADQPDNGRTKHLLVVDDNRELALMYRDLLEANGYVVSVASNGVQALKFVLENAVDAVVCDLSMPQLEGDMFHLTVQRVRPQLGGRFVFVTGNENGPKFADFLKNSGCPVLFKPVTMERLLATLNGLFEQS